MSFKKRYNLAVEEADVLDNVEATEITVQDVIEASEVEQEIREQQAELAQDQAALEEAEAVVDELQEQVADNEQLLEQAPEAVTDDVVAMSQESYYNAIGRLGYTTKDVYRVSIESSSSPAERLRLSTEGIKEFMSNLIKKIKEIIGKCLDWIKRMWLKFGPAYKMLRKKIKALYDEAKKSTQESFTLTKDNIEKYAFASYVIDANLNPSNIYKADPNIVINGFTKYLEDSVKLYKDIIQNNDKEYLENMEIWDKGFEKITQDFRGLGDEAGKEIEPNASEFLIYSTNGVLFRYLALLGAGKDSKLIAGRYKAKDYNKAEIKDISKSKSDFINNIKGMITYSSKTEDKLKSISEKSLNKLKSTMDEFEKLGNERAEYGGGALALLFKGAYNGYSALATKVIPSITLDAYEMAKNHLSLYSAALKNSGAKADDKKEDKK